MIGAHDTTGDRRVGRYVLGERIGKGGMAEVFIGHVIGARGFRKPVAIKRLLATRAGDLDSIERLIGEAKLLVGLQHGNVVSVLDLVCEGDDVFVVMEYVDGPSVRQLLKLRGEQLPIAIATYVVHAAAIGLEYAHVRPGGAVIHADISPSNLLLTRTGEVRVADFGIARREGVGAGWIEGKWAYMAPEQARGELLTPRADVFALGVVLYELISGARPRSTAAGYEHCLSATEATPLHVLAPAAPAALSRLCERCLADDPSERPSMKELRDTLLDLRYAERWRDGAGELAELIREAAVPSPRMPHSVATALVSIRPSQVALTAEPEPKMFATGTVHGRQSESVIVPVPALSSLVTVPTMAAVSAIEDGVSVSMSFSPSISESSSESARSMSFSPSISESSSEPARSMSFGCAPSISESGSESARSMSFASAPSSRESGARRSPDAVAQVARSMSVAASGSQASQQSAASHQSLSSLVSDSVSHATPAMRSLSSIASMSPSGSLSSMASLSIAPAGSLPAFASAPSMHELAVPRSTRSRWVWIFTAGMIAGVAAAWITYNDDRLTVAPQPIARTHVVAPLPGAVVEPGVVVEPIEPETLPIETAAREPVAIDPTMDHETIPAIERAYREPAVALPVRKPARRDSVTVERVRESTEVVVNATIVRTAEPLTAPAVVDENRGQTARKPESPTAPVVDENRARKAEPSTAPAVDENRGQAARKSEPPAAIVVDAPPRRTVAALVTSGTELFLAGKLGEAREAFEGALAIDPDNALAHRGLGFVFQRSGATAKAIASLRAYLTLRPAAHDAAAIEARIARLGGS